jgi:hypothetical protein
MKYVVVLMRQASHLSLEEIMLAPFSRKETAGQVAALTGAPPPVGFVEEVYARRGG